MNLGTDSAWFVGMAVSSQGHWEECNPVWYVVTLLQIRVSSPLLAPGVPLDFSVSIRRFSQEEVLVLGGWARTQVEVSILPRGKGPSHREALGKRLALLSEGLKGPRTASPGMDTLSPVWHIAHQAWSLSSFSVSVGIYRSGIHGV